MDGVAFGVGHLHLLLVGQGVQFLCPHEGFGEQGGGESMVDDVDEANSAAGGCEGVGDCLPLFWGA